MHVTFVKVSLSLNKSLFSLSLSPGYNGWFKFLSVKRAVSQGKIVLGVSGFVAGSVILSSARRLRRFRGALRWRIGFLMSGQSGNDILCVAAGCGFKGNSGRLFDHFWKVHRAEDWPRSWIERFRLSQCPKCLPWYSRLISHTPKCYATRPSCASAAVGAVAAVDFVIPSPGVTHASQDIATPTSQQITDDNSHHNPQLTPPVPSIISPLSPGILDNRDKKRTHGGVHCDA